MGIFNVGSLANYPLKLLEKKFGVMGRQVLSHAWGIDFSKIGGSVNKSKLASEKVKFYLEIITIPRK